MGYLEGKFSWLKERIKTHRKMIASVLVFLSVFGVVGFASANVMNLVEVNFEGALTWLAGIVNAVAQGAGHLILLTIEMIIVPAMGYNSFGSSAIVGVGWSLVRDVVNMFVIVILLVIAIQTILGISKANIQQQLPRLVIAVIVVNFSKTICLLMIDMGQVVMFTFVNAIREVAAGNFVSLFQIQSLYNSNPALGDQAVSGWLILATAYFTLALMLAILATLLILAIVLLYRIVVLWILIILSPLAFFMGGLKDVIGAAGGTYSDWWGKMIGAITLGPILAFFLWLSLSASAGGKITSTEHFPISNTTEGVGLMTSAFRLEEFTSILVGLILIMVGFQAASSAASQMGGVASTLVNEGMGKKIVGGAAKLPAIAGYRAGRKAGGFAVGTTERWTRSVDGYGTGGKGTGVFENVSNKMASGGAAVRNLGTGFTAIGDTIIGAAGGVKAATDYKTEGVKKARENFDGRDMSGKMAVLSSISKEPESAFTGGREYADSAGLTALATDRGLQKQAEKELGEEKFNELMGLAIKHVEKNKDDLLDDAQKGKFLKTKAQNLHTLSDEDKRKVIDDDDFKLNMLSDKAAADKAVQSVLAAKASSTWETMPDGTKRSISLLEEGKLGKGVSMGVKDALNNVEKAKKIDFSDKDELAKATAAQVGATLRAGLNAPTDITKEHLAGDQREILVNGIIDSGKSINEFNIDVKNEVLQEAKNQRATADTLKKIQIDKLVFEGEGDITSAFGVDADGKMRDADSRVAAQGAIMNNPVEVSKFEEVVQRGHSSGAGNEVTETVVAAASQDTFNKIVSQFNDKQTTEPVRQQLRAAMKTFGTAIEAEINKVGNNAPKSLRNLQDSFRMSNRRVGVSVPNSGRRTARNTGPSPTASPDNPFDVF